MKYTIFNTNFLYFAIMVFASLNIYSFSIIEAHLSPTSLSQSLTLSINCICSPSARRRRRESSWTDWKIQWKRGKMAGGRFWGMWIWILLKLRFVSECVRMDVRVVAIALGLSERSSLWQQLQGSVKSDFKWSLYHWERQRQRKERSQKASRAKWRGSVQERPNTHRRFPVCHILKPSSLFTQMNGTNIMKCNDSLRILNWTGPNGSSCDNTFYSHFFWMGIKGDLCMWKTSLWTKACHTFSIVATTPKLSLSLTLFCRFSTHCIPIVLCNIYVFFSTFGV